jgi:hypothetical protein
MLTICVADALWDALKASNSDLAETFANLTRMSVQDSEAYANEVAALASTTGDQVSILARETWSSTDGASE